MGEPELERMQPVARLFELVGGRAP
jgi:hypothetical protein